MEGILTMRSLLQLRLVPLAVMGALFMAGSAFGQAGPPLGSDFIVFVNGTNVTVPGFGGTVTADPTDASNTVIRYDYGNWAFNAFTWETSVGVDMTGNQTADDSVFFRIWSDPMNAGQANVTLSFMDKTDGSGANDGTADNEFRAQWVIPQGMHTGQWFDVGIPLPPSTWQALEDARGTADSTFNAWRYGGAWSTGGFGIGVSDLLGPNTADNPQLWQEFEWTNVHAIGIFFDNNTQGGPIYIDDLYIGSGGLDLSVADSPADAMSGVTFADATGFNSISWAPNTDFGGYKVYVSESAITDVTAAGVELLATLGLADGEEVEHRLEVPHPTLSGSTVYYAVTSLSQFGVENQDVAASAGSISNATLPIQPIILEMTTAEADTVFDNIFNGVASPAGFPQVEPFRLNSEHSQLSETLTLPDDDTDLSGTFWLAFSDQNELFVYAEVVDDSLELGPVKSGGEAWQYDSIEFGWGNYDVRDAGGSIIFGSPHSDMERGAFADYQLRIAGYQDGQSSAWVDQTGAAGEIQGGGTVYDTLMNDLGEMIGYKTLTIIPLTAIQNTATGDVVLDPPTGDEIRLIPWTVSLNDADGSGRDHQITWSLKNNVNNNWWNTPNQWQTVAMAGRGTATNVDDEFEVPKDFVLEQNYPNPFNPTTAIRFSLPTAESVTLKVYNVLGREVATLLSGEQMAAGRQTVTFQAQDLASGVYVYRLEAGSFEQTKQMVLLK